MESTTSLFYLLRDDACSFIARQAYQSFCRQVVIEALRKEPSLSLSIHASEMALCAPCSRTRQKAQLAIDMLYRSLDQAIQYHICSTQYRLLSNAFGAVFNINIGRHDIDAKSSYNRKTLESILMRYLCVGYDVEHPSDIDARCLFKMLYNFHEYSGHTGCIVMEGLEDVTDVVLRYCPY